MLLPDCVRMFNYVNCLLFHLPGAVGVALLVCISRGSCKASLQLMLQASSRCITLVKCHSSGSTPVTARAGGMYKLAAGVRSVTQDTIAACSTVIWPPCTLLVHVVSSCCKPSLCAARHDYHL